MLPSKKGVLPRQKQKSLLRAFAITTAPDHHDRGLFPFRSFAQKYFGT
jgi:hypothetical protein